MECSNLTLFVECLKVMQQVIEASILQLWLMLLVEAHSLMLSVNPKVGFIAIHTLVVV